MRPRDLDDLTPQQLDLCLPESYKGDRQTMGNPLMAAAAAAGGTGGE